MDEDNIKIAIFVANLNGGGAERMMVNLAKGFSERNIKTDLVLSSAQGPYLEEVPDCVNIVDLKSPRVLYSIYGLRKYLINNKPNILISTLSRVNAAAIIAKKLTRVKTKLVLREANTFSVYSKTSNKVWEKLINFITKKLYPLSDQIVAVSRGVATDLKNVLSVQEDKIQVIYNPVVDDTLFAKAKERIEHPWFNNDKQIILGIGRVSEQKDFSTLIRAFNEVSKQKDTKLVLLGEYDKKNHEYQKLVTIIDELNLHDKVDFLGFVKNPFAYLSRASVFVLSSRWEGLPGVLIQALACGCTVVSTNCPSGPDEILNDGEFGHLVEIGDYKSMAEKIIYSLENPEKKEKLIDRSKMFSISQSIDKYLNLGK